LLFLQVYTLSGQWLATMVLYAIGWTVIVLAFSRLWFNSGPPALECRVSSSLSLSLAISTSINQLTSIIIANAVSDVSLRISSDLLGWIVRTNRRATGVRFHGC
jgi:putative Mn2+ efflux pump MntP